MPVLIIKSHNSVDKEYSVCVCVSIIIVFLNKLGIELGLTKIRFNIRGAQDIAFPEILDGEAYTQNRYDNVSEAAAR